ncbi:hypothetical protein GYMLUDRAFT_75221 [Collybiopsis luxurians FD-317 M1]|uniref:DUF6533 domain-containing protein n=1 Tax=Collybiopsis luxurians FD-317 M1 TaxID=944289 RepID=A0A0D0C5Z5_9AGAR|nr:hypothetical protein GYMLUDRAFT_75221 [Collybiopsis luxurians FD-317 M1]
METTLKTALSGLLSEAIRDNRAATACTIAAFTILVYDCILTFDKEITYIWKSPWTMPKLLYILVKYYGLAQLSGGPVIFTTLVNIILGLRLHALYRSSKLVAALILFLLIAIAEFWGSYHIASLLEMSVPLNSLAELEPYIPNIEDVLPGCVLGALPSLRFTLVSFISHLCLSGTLFGLMAYKCLQSIPWKIWLARWGHSADINLHNHSTAGNVIVFYVRDATVVASMMITLLHPSLTYATFP